MSYDDETHDHLFGHHALKPVDGCAMCTIEKQITKLQAQVKELNVELTRRAQSESELRAQAKTWCEKAEARWRDFNAACAERDEARATAELHQAALAAAEARENEAYDWLIAGINPAMKVNPEALSHMIDSIRGQPLLVHLKVAANTIKHQSEALEKAQAERKELAADQNRLSFDRVVRERDDWKKRYEGITDLAAEMRVDPFALPKLREALSGIAFDLTELVDEGYDLGVGRQRVSRALETARVALNLEKSGPNPAPAEEQQKPAAQEGNPKP